MQKKSKSSYIVGKGDSLRVKMGDLLARKREEFFGSYTQEWKTNDWNLPALFCRSGQRGSPLYTRDARSLLGWEKKKRNGVITGGERGGYWPTDASGGALVGWPGKRQLVQSGK